MKNGFKILYTDGTEVEGDSFEGDWKQLNVTKEIAKLQYVLGNSCVVMEGFKEYNHLKECVGLQVKGYTKVILMGRTNGKSLVIIFDLINNKIVKLEKPYGEEFGKQVLDGWRKGKLDNPRANIKNLNKDGLHNNVQ